MFSRFSVPVRLKLETNTSTLSSHRSGVTQQGLVLRSGNWEFICRRKGEGPLPQVVHHSVFSGSPTSVFGSNRTGNEL